MTEIIPDIPGYGDGAAGPATLQVENPPLLPVWVRPPMGGHEHFSGFSRSKLYELASKGLIRSVSIRGPGETKGVRLFHLGSVLDFIARCETESKSLQQKGGVNRGVA